MNPTSPDAFLMTEARWCRDALAVQNACNPSGIAHSMAALCEQMHAQGLSTTAIADHPATRLYAAKLADLCGISIWFPKEAETKANDLIRRAKSLTPAP